MSDELLFKNSSQNFFLLGDINIYILINNKIKLNKSISSGLDDKEYVVGLFLDLTKAFDCVDHKLLIKKLYGCGFRGFVLDWLNSFLSGREQKVLINKFLSGPSKIDIGVQQGSVLGPVLFIIYINSIFNLPLKGKIFCYADVIAIVYSSPNLGVDQGCYL